jgi:hypothetical protein
LDWLAQWLPRLRHRPSLKVCTLVRTALGLTSADRVTVSAATEAIMTTMPMTAGSAVAVGR